MPRVLGVDPGATTTGWAVVEDGRVIAHGVVNSKQENIRDGTWHLYLASLLARAALYMVQCVVVEAHVSKPRGNRKIEMNDSFMLNQAWPMVIAELFRARGLQVRRVYAQTWHAGRSVEEAWRELAPSLTASTYTNDEKDAAAMAVWYELEVLAGRGGLPDDGSVSPDPKPRAKNKPYHVGDGRSMTIGEYLRQKGASK